MGVELDVRHEHMFAYAPDGTVLAQVAGSRAPTSSQTRRREQRERRRDPERRARSPITSAIGPQIASPSGWNASEPNQSYALTRESDSSGTWRISVDSQSALPNIIATPASSAPNASTPTGAPAARNASGNDEEPEGERRRQERPARSRAHGDETSDHGADAQRGQHRAPRRGAAQRALGDHRPERAPRAPEHVPDRRREHERPHPGQRPEHAPALAQVGEERGRGARHARRQPQQRAGTRR